MIKVLQRDIILDVVGSRKSWLGSPKYVYCYLLWREMVLNFNHNNYIC